MKRILMRAAMLPLENLDTFQIVTENKFGTNAGNMFFPYSLCRTLITDETGKIDPIIDMRDNSQKRVQELNEQYDCFLIPLANAFRVSFRNELERMTDFIKKLKIPCIVVGIGLQDGVDATGDTAHEFDEQAKNFVKAVLDKSAIMGVRGEITANYLKHLGFREETDYTIIGCPSMFTFGSKLPQVNRRELTFESMVCMNRKVKLPKKLHVFLEKCQKEFPNHYFIPQNTFDFRLLYAGLPLDAGKEENKKVPGNYPKHYLDACFQEDKVRGFVNVPTWLDFLSKATLNFGSRIHGNIAGVLAGTPSYIFASDSRILELAEYHRIPHMLAKDIKETTNLSDIYEATDFDVIHQGHEERFDHYLDFLHKNGLETVYDGGEWPEKLPFDKKMEVLELEPPLTPLILQDPKEQMRRREDYFRYLMDRNAELRWELSDERRKVSKRIIKRLRRFL